MYSLDLTDGAIELLKALASKSGTATPDTAEMQALWGNRLVMGSYARTHITAQGKKFILRIMEVEKSSSADHLGIDPLPLGYSWRVRWVDYSESGVNWSQ
jgi:hypothetical protein